jgi:hypothetical protein
MDVKLIIFCFITTQTLVLLEYILDPAYLKGKVKSKPYAKRLNLARESGPGGGVDE